ncbi:MAG TPA: tetratricopeptide repeat protein [Candidatus Acidoferrum sp.]|nr:tetratricopeptide repeat protein [Candidatus Acidoferrum sp.]
MGWNGRRLRFGTWGALFLSSAVIAWPLVGAAQIPTVAGGAGGQILVRVYEPDGSPFRKSAIVTLRSTTLLTNSTTPTTDAGQALFTGLSAGDYVVEVSAPGYRTAQANAVIAADKEIENIDVRLELDTGREGVQQVPGPPILAPKALKEMEQGMQALQAGKLDQAEEHLNRAQKLAPGFPDVNYLLGLLWMRRNDNAKARSYLEKAVAMAPKHALALQALGEVMFLQGDYGHAIEVLGRSIAQRPNSWRAHWLEGASYFQQRDFKKAREECAEALRQGQNKAGSVRFLLGAAEASLGEREEALATLELFLRDEPKSPQAATAKKIVEQLRAVQESESSGGGALKAVEDGSSLPVSGNSVAAALPPVAPLAEREWAPPNVDDQRPDLETGASCPMATITSSAGAHVEELVKDIDRFTATEELEHISLSRLGVPLARELRTFSYVAAIRKIGPRELDVQEYRDGSVSMQGFPGHLATVGLPVLALVFHPYYRNEFDFQCEGLGKRNERAAWVVHFRQRDDQMSEMRVFWVNGRSFPIRLKGRAWIDATSMQILAMEADMIKPVPEIRLRRDFQIIEYGPVEFQKTKTALWLPRSAEWYCDFMGHRYHRRHSFSHFMLFSVEDRQQIGAPKIADQN